MSKVDVRVWVEKEEKLPSKILTTILSGREQIYLATWGQRTSVRSPSCWNKPSWQLTFPFTCSKFKVHSYSVYNTSYLNSLGTKRRIMCLSINRYSTNKNVMHFEKSGNDLAFDLCLTMNGMRWWHEGIPSTELIQITTDWPRSMTRPDCVHCLGRQLMMMGLWR